MSLGRLCPLCDDYRQETICPEHGISTLPDGFAQNSKTLRSGDTVLDRFRIDEQLSRGQLATVFRGRQLGVERPVCIKALASEKVVSELRRFYVEARATSRLEHPNIVGMFEFGIDLPSATPLIVMEFLEGRTLQSLLQDGPLPEKRTVSILQQVASALSLAHEREVLHRDLKPSNLMVRVLPDGSEHVVVLDFGVAKILDAENAAPLTLPGMCVGTPSFMAPEQVRGGPQDARTDLYGLGCVMHAMLTGTPPYAGGPMLAVMSCQLDAPPPVLPDRLSDGAPPSAALRTLHDSLLAKTKDARPDSALDVLRALKSLSGTSDNFSEAATEDAAFDFDTEVDPQIEEATESGPLIRPAKTEPAVTQIAPQPLGLEDAPPSIRLRAEKLNRRPQIQHASLLGTWTVESLAGSRWSWLLALAILVLGAVLFVAMR